MKLQKYFPYLRLFKLKFDIDNTCVFAWDNEIYTNYMLLTDFIAHENCHLKQQNEYGKYTWLKNYLFNKEARLKYEIEAYRVQLNCFKDRNLQHNKRIEYAKILSSPMYKCGVSFNHVLNLL